MTKKKSPDAWDFLIHMCFGSEYVPSARGLWLSVEAYKFLRIL